MRLYKQRNNTHDTVLVIEANNTEETVIVNELYEQIIDHLRELKFNKGILEGRKE